MYATSVPASSVLFVSRASLSAESGRAATKYGLRKRLEPVKKCRGIGKRDMRLNDVMPKMKVDPESYAVFADGKHCTAEPAGILPLTQAYFVY